MVDPKATRSETPLTQQEFNGLLQRLSSQPVEAGEKYEELRWKLIKFFQWSACINAEELADETLDRVARKLHKGDEHIQNLEAFVWGVAKRIRQEGQRRGLRTVHLAETPNHIL